MQAARKIKTLKIVTYDWLEDSLLARSPKGVANYLLKQHVKVEKKRKAKQKEKVKETVKAGSKQPYFNNLIQEINFSEPG